jgi:DNA-binding IclR family transcriptional regulator
VNLGASAVAAPVATPTGGTSSIAVIAPQQRFNDAMEQELISQVVWAAAELGRRLGDPQVGLNLVS